jgi:predicted nucleic-acid-binding protein
LIAIDTNVLLRYILQDEARQAALATKLLEGSLSARAPGFVSLVVVCELVWALGRTYSIPNDRIAAFLAYLAEAPQFDLEDRETVMLAANGSGDIADVIIHGIGRRHGCSHTVTFDKKFAQLDGVSLLT